MEKADWLEEVYSHINAAFESEHLPKILDLVRQPSVAGTGEGIDECAEKVMELLRSVGCVDVHLEQYVKSPVVVGRLNADVENAPGILMYGMYDVQPPEPYDEWIVPPYEGARIDFENYGECIVARGIMNSKGPLVCFLNAVDSIRKTLGYMPVNVLFVVEGEEELGSESMIPFVEAHKEEIAKLDGVFLNGARQDEQGRPAVLLGNKGTLYLDLEVTGGEWGGPQKIDLHSMNAAWVGSPAWRLVNALSTMRQGDDILIEGFYDDLKPLSEADEQLTRRFASVFDEEMFLNERLYASRFLHDMHGEEAVRKLMWTPTLNIDGIWGGYTGPATKTVIPYKVQAKVDVRLVPPLTADMMLEKIKKHLNKHGYDDVKITVRQSSPWSKSDPEALACRAALMALDNSGYDQGYAWPIFPGTGPAYLFTQRCGVPFVSYGLGQGGRIHAPNEYHTVKGLRENEMSCAAYLYYLTKLAHEAGQ
ncbi:M20/M25/M40 family metallo-hydrolase [Oscillibacter hominis]|uniref:M20/M25/M40 family metallo-hydrolase n=1 Tax=Oscillibacter hominis TaxID=2763056 RepID=A0A7G9B305_9FIRM|nr:M20/M25/M40 family metallo-hydrolase [Oscillibacter hominis]QNL43936.1 M20/M25/M40 family metallo-hydrolase [Oscillibacter hominis]